MSHSEGEPTDAYDRALRLIVGYKLLKAVGELLAGALLFIGSAGVAEDLRALAVDIRHHVAAGWSISLAEKLIRATSGRSLNVIGMALLLDGALSIFEGWVLHRRYRWSGWFVIGTTSSLLPFEVVALFMRLSVVRLALLLLNVLIVGYLLRRQIPVGRESHRAHRL